MKHNFSQDEGCPPKPPDPVRNEGGPLALNQFWYVYILRSINHPKEIYVGLSKDPKYRIAKHNRGENRSTARYRPWTIISITGFPSQKKAEEFERYLKSGSGRAFRKKHLA